MSSMHPTAAMKTDRYELTMLSAFVEEGSVHHRAVFEAFCRRLPEGRRYAVAAGLGRLIKQIQAFRFDGDELRWLLDQGAITTKTAEYLEGFRFGGTIRAYREGEIFFPGSPIFTVEASLGEAVVLETLVLSVLNHDSAIASAAARMVDAAEGRPIIEMGSRRTHEDAALATARAAYLAGFASTSNLAAGILYGIPTGGTAAHTFTLSHPDELSAFRAQVAAHGPGTTLLVDTYDMVQGVRHAVEAAGPDLGAVRIDSGDLGVEARRVRALLDSLGNPATKIIITSDLDEYVITALADAPIDSYGVGTRVATGSGHPAAELVYKLVAIADADGPDAPMRSVAKQASGKVSIGGRKMAYRELDETGTAVAERIVVGDETALPTGPRVRPLQVVVLVDGDLVHSPSLEQTRAFHASVRAELPAEARGVTNGPPALVASL